eukprot:gnl/Chilomastix_cuspidata/4266.p1 GENE.gnl/Chilomastix_cuspidata/4266~~gnl/Chilomastix_cuspidata/4266.p1  ORF type:complete len:725 (+),score=258.87 gnl/Chilomastix_cuspidata/4266:67-2241(+)
MLEIAKNKKQLHAIGHKYSDESALNLSISFKISEKNIQDVIAFIQMIPKLSILKFDMRPTSAEIAVQFFHNLYQTCHRMSAIDVQLLRFKPSASDAQSLGASVAQFRRLQLLRLTIEHAQDISAPLCRALAAAPRLKDLTLAVAAVSDLQGLFDSLRGAPRLERISVSAKRFDDAEAIIYTISESAAQTHAKEILLSGSPKFAPVQMAIREALARRSFLPPPPEPSADAQSRGDDEKDEEMLMRFPRVDDLPKIKARLPRAPDPAAEPAPEEPDLAFLTREVARLKEENEKLAETITQLVADSSPDAPPSKDAQAASLVHQAASAWDAVPPPPIASDTLLMGPVLFDGPMWKDRAGILHRAPVGVCELSAEAARAIACAAQGLCGCPLAPRLLGLCETGPSTAAVVTEPLPLSVDEAVERAATMPFGPAWAEGAIASFAFALGALLEQGVTLSSGEHMPFHPRFARVSPQWGLRLVQLAGFSRSEVALDRGAIRAEVEAALPLLRRLAEIAGDTSKRKVSELEAADCFLLRPWAREYQAELASLAQAPEHKPGARLEGGLLPAPASSRTAALVRKLLRQLDFTDDGAQILLSLGPVVPRPLAAAPGATVDRSDDRGLRSFFRCTVMEEHRAFLYVPTFLPAARPAPLPFEPAPVGAYLLAPPAEAAFHMFLVALDLAHASPEAERTRFRGCSVATSPAPPTVAVEDPAVALHVCTVRLRAAGAE